MTKKRAMFFGEETGGSCLDSSSGDFINLTLPHVTIPIRNYIINVSFNSKIRRGVTPDYEITSSIKDVLEENDAGMKFIYDFISKNKHWH
jgi:hypothetical protein